MSDAAAAKRAAARERRKQRILRDAGSRIATVTGAAPTESTDAGHDSQDHSIRNETEAEQHVRAHAPSDVEHTTSAHSTVATSMSSTSSATTSSSATASVHGDTTTSSSSYSHDTNKRASAMPSGPTDQQLRQMMETLFPANKSSLPNTRLSLGSSPDPLAAGATATGLPDMSSDNPLRDASALMQGLTNMGALGGLGSAFASASSQPKAAAPGPPLWLRTGPALLTGLVVLLWYYLPLVAAYLPLLGAAARLGGFDNSSSSNDDEPVALVDLAVCTTGIDGVSSSRLAYVWPIHLTIQTLVLGAVFSYQETPPSLSSRAMQSVSHLVFSSCVFLVVLLLGLCVPPAALLSADV